MPSKLIEDFLANPEERNARIAKQLDALRSPINMTENYLRAGGSTNNKSIDEAKLADLLAQALKKNPSFSLSMDYHGFKMGIKEGASLREKDINEFKM